jgi:hypothetical protein
VLGTLVVGLALLHLCSPHLMRKPGDLSVWNPGMPLLVGNELSADRGWNGAVMEVALADRAASDEEVLALCRGADPTEIFQASLLGRYLLRGSAPFKDETGALPNLNWADRPPLIADLGAVITPSEWLKSDGPVIRASQRVAQASQFTLAITAESHVGDPRGPGRPPSLGPWRIVSISDSVFRQNVLIGQEESDLTVRVRTAIRSTPTLYIRDVFHDVLAHHIVVTQQQAVTVIYVDGAERGRCEVTPEAKLIWRLYPRGDVRLRLERYGFRSYAAIYRLLVFIPLASLLGAMLMTTRLERGKKAMVGVGFVALFALALELVFGAESASGFQVKNLLMSLAIGLGTLGALALWRMHAREG